jgi:hypothetical protein
MARTGVAPCGGEGLIVSMLYRDALDAVVSHIDDDARLAVWLTCKAFISLRPAGKFLTSVSVMWATPAVLEWAIGIG